MEIYPKHQLRRCFQGEAYVRELLALLDHDGIVIHSVNLPQHPKKRWGEIDFLIFYPNHIIALEVKGGYVSCNDGVWKYSDSKSSYTTYESPLEQVQSAVLALEHMIFEGLGKKIKVHYGIVFPFSVVNYHSMYFPENIVADKETCKDLKLFSNWLNNIIIKKKNLNNLEIEKIREYLLPRFDIAMTRRLSNQFILEQINEYTEEQKQYFGVLDSNKMIVVFGGAGTGKTELLISTALKEKIKGNKPVVLTKHKILKECLEEKLAEWEIPVTTNFIPVEANVLLIDEGQDFYCFELLKPYLDRFKSGRIRIFMDKNYQYLKHPPSPELINWYYENALIVNLQTNVRNTDYMINAVEGLINTTLDVAKVKGIGNKVDIDTFEDENELNEKIIRFIENLYDEIVSEHKVVILYQQMDYFIKNLINRLINKKYNIFKFISLNKCNESYLTYGSVANFRGLEADHVILIINNRSELSAQYLSDIYIGMTRARINLMVLCHEECMNNLLFKL